MEDFVPYYLAVKLKEKGFREECLAYYHTDGELLYNRDQYRGGNYKSLLRSYNSLPKNPIGCEQIDAPTISQVMKWLRKEYKIYMYVERDTYHLKFRFVYEKDKPRGKFTSSIYDTYEQSALAGVNYCLDNLI